MNIEARAAPAIRTESSPISPSPSRPPIQADHGDFKRVFERLAKEVDRGERVVRIALRGNPYADDTKGMIALQAGVYKYVEAVELCTKLVDRSANAVKTTLQNQ